MVGKGNYCTSVSPRLIVSVWWWETIWLEKLGVEIMWNIVVVLVGCLFCCLIISVSLWWIVDGLMDDIVKRMAKEIKKDDSD